MTYTKEQRKIIHNQLVAAKKRLWDGKGDQPPCDFDGMQLCICIAISRTQGLYYYDGGSEMLACEMISRRLGGRKNSDLKDWLESVAKIPQRQLSDLAVQTYRHEWLDHLIKEFSK